MTCCCLLDLERAPGQIADDFHRKRAQFCDLNRGENYDEEERFSFELLMIMLKGRLGKRSLMILRKRCGKFCDLN